MTAGLSTPGIHSRNCSTDAPSLRFSKRAATGTLVPRNTHTPLSLSAWRSTAGHVSQSIMRSPRLLLAAVHLLSGLPGIAPPSVYRYRGDTAAASAALSGRPRLSRPRPTRPASAPPPQTHQVCSPGTDRRHCASVPLTTRPQLEGRHALGHQPCDSYPASGQPLTVGSRRLCRHRH